jgi:polysaccharide export outer membrane protein
MKSWLVLLGLVALSQTGCASPRLEGGQQVTVVSASELPPPAVAGPNGERRFEIGPFDRLAVDVFGIPELSRTVQADASGHISLPLVGDLTAGGSTPEELATAVADRLRGRYVRDPQVSVNMVDTVSHTMTVDGAVTEPGQYPVLGRMTLMRAIARARGVTEFAQQRHVVVFRTVGDQQYAALYDLQAIRQGIYGDPEIYANDVISVGDSQARRLFRDLIQGSGLLTAPLIALIQTRGTN